MCHLPVFYLLLGGQAIENHRECGGISSKMLGKRSQRQRSTARHDSIDEIDQTDNLRCQGQERSPLKMTVFERVLGIQGHGDVLFLDLGLGLVNESSC